MTTSHAIDQAIEALEHSLNATRIPGELSDWLGPVQSALAQTRHVLRGEAAPRHRRDFAEIAKNPTFKPKQEQLRSEDEALLASIVDTESLASQAGEMLTRSHGQLEDVTMLEEIGERLHAIVIRLRSQEQAIDTWVMESVNRDEGVSG